MSRVDRYDTSVGHRCTLCIRFCPLRCDRRFLTARLGRRQVFGTDKTALVLIKHLAPAVSDTDALHAVALIQLCHNLILRSTARTHVEQVLSRIHCLIDTPEAARRRFVTLQLALVRNRRCIRLLNALCIFQLQTSLCRIRHLFLRCLFRRFCLSSRHLHLLLCLIRKGKSRMAYANGPRRDHNRGHRRPETFPVIRCAWLSFSAFSSCHL